jgi:radical SAM protein with 4Fe4S-binding SPASM domain
VAAIRLAVGQGIPVAASVVMIKANLGRLRDTAEKALALGANHVVFNRFIGLPGQEFALTEGQLRAAMREVKQLETEGYPARFGNCIPQCFEASTALGCSAGFSYCTVDPWGNVRPCNHAPWQAGNLLRDEMTTIWRSDTMRRWRRLQPAACRDCPASAACLGGCHAIALGRDPLMAGPAGVSALRPTTPAAMTLFAGATPVPRFTALPEESDACLISEGRVLRLPAGAKPLLVDLFQGKTLSQLEEAWGQVGLSIVAWLYYHHFLELNDSTAVRVELPERDPARYPPHPHAI